MVTTQLLEKFMVPCALQKILLRINVWVNKLNELEVKGALSWVVAAPWPRYGLCNLYSVCRGECLLGFLAVFSEVFFLVLSREKEIT